jgi:hypothetical protein
VGFGFTSEIALLSRVIYTLLPTIPETLHVSLIVQEDALWATVQPDEEAENVAAAET